MCGIVALVSTDGGRIDDTVDRLERRVDEALQKIEHRGPDGRGVWVDPSRTVVLAHCRLSINDLSPTGHQPLHSPDNSIHAVVNGELYDYDALRSSLESKGHTFNGHSDSELVLALYKQYGMSFLSQLRGEFAIVIYDESSRTFVAVRDRYGIKPLFWRKQGEIIMFGAEMKAFLPLGWRPQWDVGAVIDGGWGIDSRTVFKGVQKLRPGHYMVVKDGVTEIRQYWEAEYPDKRLKETRTEEEMIQNVQNLLIESVKQRLRADVPVGIYLSGGIDSSVIAGIATHLVNTRGFSMGCNDPSERVCCFSIAFDEESGFDESDISQRTAEHLGVKFLKQHMSEAELAKRFEDAVYHCEHQNFDLNFIGKFALSELPRQHGYKVVLTGEGSDEQFAGYPLYVPDYLLERDLASPQTAVPEEKREKLLQDILASVPARYAAFGADPAYFGKPSEQHLPLITPGGMMGFQPPVDLFSAAARMQYEPVDPLTTLANNVPGWIRSKIENLWHPLHSAMYVWGKAHLSNNFLSCLGDRVEMAHSVEARTPFLDHHLTEYVNSLPPSMKLRLNSTGLVEKYALKEASKPFITDEVYKRKKHPYTAPTTYPLGGPVNLLLERLLTEERVKRLGFVDWEQVLRLKARAFVVDKPDVWAWRQIMMTAQWTVLSERFGVDTWTSIT